MAEEKTYYDWLFEESEEEKDIHRRLDEERERFENTDVYKEHYAKVTPIRTCCKCLSR